MRSPRPVHIDSDPGLDDLLALAVAFASPEIEVVGLTTVAGSAPLDAVTDNAQRFLALCRVEIPLGRGASRPRVLAPPDPTPMHGEDGRRGVSLPAIDRRPLPSAGEVLEESLRGGARCVVALGPLTNLAGLAAEQPGALRDLEVVWMGGALEAGDATARSEFNCWADPHAAREVLEAAAAVRIIDLDVARHVRLRPADFPEPAFGAGRVARFLGDLIAALMRAEVVTEGERCATLPGAAAVLAACDPTLFRYEPVELDIRAEEGSARGQMRRAAASADPTCRFAVEVDAPEICRRLRDRLCAWAEACE